MTTTSPDETPWKTSGELPLRFEPRDSSDEARSLDRLLAGLDARREWVQEQLTDHGALLFRGFDIEKPLDFEAVARAISPTLGKDYMGTSPRDHVTEYVFNASELPDFFPIPQHCEMSFCGKPPSYLFFFGLEPCAPDSGETPLCDFRKVWNELDPGVRDRFVEGGIRIVRNYASPDADTTDNPTQLKSWPEIFGTTDHAVVEARCREEGFEPEWSKDDALKLVSTQPAGRAHPKTGVMAWFSHITTFHVTTALAEYRRIAALRPTDRHKGLIKIAEALEEKLRALPSEQQAMHSTYLDGSEFPAEDLEHLRDVIWQNMVIDSWQQGDVVAIDNFAVSHGRLPYEGPRQIAVCWS